MIQQLTLHEGLRLTPYTDTLGVRTVGIGYNLAERGLEPIARVLGRPITAADIEAGLSAHEWTRVALSDIRATDARLRDVFPGYDLLNEVRKRVFIDVVFNLGETRARKFQQAIRWAKAAVDKVGEVGEAYWTAAAYHLLDSVYARQVGDGLGGRLDRGDRLGQMLITGQDYTR